MSPRSLVTDHSQEYYLYISQWCFKFESDTAFDWLNHMV